MTQTLRTFLLSLLFASLAASVSPAQTGRPVPELAALDRNVEALRSKWKLPGASLAVAYRGRLVYARGFGEADRGRPLQPDTLFRIASVSKPLTAVTLLKLQEASKLNLNQNVFDILPELRPLLGDPRMRSVTVRQLLQHTAGWSNDSGDPLFADYETLAALGAPFPPSLDDIVAVWLQRPLEFAPGSRYAYSNFGFALAGLVIERVSGMSYAQAVRSLVLEPLQISRMRVARTLAPAPGETRYSSLSPNDRVLSVFSPEPKTVPEAYGGYAIENMAAGGGWLATPSDLLRFLTAVDGSRASSFLTQESFRQLVAKPAGLASNDSWYGLGFDVIQQGPEFVLTHNGALSNTSYAYIARGLDGVSFAFQTNAFFSDADADKLAQFELEMLQAIASVTSQTRNWPAGDLFEPVYSRPIPRPTAVVNAASWSSSAVAPGEILSIPGTLLGPARGVLAPFADGRFPTTESGIRVWFDATPAPLLFVQDGQINLVAPFDVSAKKNVSITVERDGAWSAPLSLKVEPAHPGIFADQGFGDQGTALALNQDGSLHRRTAPARRGSIVTLFLTGTGALERASDGAAAQGTERLLLPVSVKIGGLDAKVLYAGPSPGSINSLTQVNVEIPAQAPSGPVEVRVQAASALSPPGVVLHIQ